MCDEEKSKCVENLFKRTTVFECLLDAVFRRKDNTILPHKMYTITYIPCTIYSMYKINVNIFIYIYNGLLEEQQ
jgi:hypothetical protein